MSCVGTPSNLDLGQRFPNRQVGSTREIYTYRAEWYLRPIDFTNAFIQFRMVNADTGATKLPGGVGSGDINGNLVYQPVAVDVNEAGIFRCQFTATYGGAVYVSPWLQARIIRNVEVPPPVPPPPPVP